MKLTVLTVLLFAASSAWGAEVSQEDKNAALLQERPIITAPGKDKPRAKPNRHIPSEKERAYAERSKNSAQRGMQQSKEYERRIRNR